MKQLDIVCLNETPEQILEAFGKCSPKNEYGVTYGQLGQWTFYVAQESVELFLRFATMNPNRGQEPVYTISREAAARVMFAISCDADDKSIQAALAEFENKGV